MIAGLEGIVVSKDSHHLVVNVGGVFYDVLCGVTLCKETLVAKPIRLWTIHYMTGGQKIESRLYGFQTQIQKALALKIAKVQQISTRLAVDVLDAYPPQQFLEIVFAGNHALLQKIKGIGKKAAERLVHEKNKYENFYNLLHAESPQLTSAPLNEHDKLVGALVGLGYQKHLAEKTTKDILAKNAEKKDPSKEISHLLKEVIQAITS